MFGKGNKKQKVDWFKNVSFKTAFKQGNSVTKCSAVVWGLGNLINKQIIKGAIMLAFELAFIVF